MSVTDIALIVLSVSMSVAAQFCLKLGMKGVNLVTSASTSSLKTAAAIATSPMILAGFSLYGLGALTWLFVLSSREVSQAYPFVGLGFILTLLVGALVFNEHVNILRVAGTLLIVAGVILVAKST
jgi:multidrug transporter EmrE-like cation transporter